MFNRKPAPATPPRQPGRPSQEPDGIMHLRLAKAPDNTYIFQNLIAVSPEDFPPNRDGTDLYLLVQQQFVFTARPFPGFPWGQISLSDPQRTWARIAMTDTVEVQKYHPLDGRPQAYLASMDLEVGFAGRKTTETPYDQDELAQQVTKIFTNQIFAPGQQFLMDNKSIALKLTVRTVQLSDFSMEKQAASVTSSDPHARGILFRDTQMNFFKDPRTPINMKASSRRPAANAIIQPDFKFEDMGIGGLDREFGVIFRRAFASRIFPPGLVEKMGLQHVKGVLLHGPPGTGKTLIARQIGKMLNAREPKIINGPEVLNKYVGQSEENIRKLFADAEKEYKEKGDESGLHIIIFDELDAVCRQRGSGAAGGTGVGDSVVNQLLSKLDGVDQLNNILLIGMTNRMDMIDDALLRPGRLELHVEISLPDEAGRVQILKIHTQKIRQNNIMAADVDILELAALSKNFSGAEIAGLIRDATSFAFARHTKVGTMAGVSDDVMDIQITRQDFLNALEEVHAAFGVSEKELGNCLKRGLIHYSPLIDSILHDGSLYVDEVRNDPSTDLLTCILHGPPCSGKTALAAQIALSSDFPFIKLLSPEDMVGFNEMQKIQHISKAFSDAHKSKLSVLLVDNIEQLIEWVPIGPRFSSNVLNTLKVLLSQPPPEGRRLLILATTNQRSTLQNLEIWGKFNNNIAVPSVRSQEELFSILQQSDAIGSDEERKRAVDLLEEMTGNKSVGIGIKEVLLAVGTARRDRDQAERFARQVADKILDRDAV